MVTGQATIEELITVLVSEANEAEEDQYKNTDQLRMLMRKHYTVGGLTDVLSVFGPVKDDVRIREEKRTVVFTFGAFLVSHPGKDRQESSGDDLSRLESRWWFSSSSCTTTS